MNAVLETRNLAIGYARQRQQPVVVMSNINTAALGGELTCLLGPNGIGKSTLMRTMAGMQPPLAGQVLLTGEDVRALDSRMLARRLSIVLTDRVDVGTLSVYDLVALGRYPHTDWMSRLKAEDREAVTHALAIVGAASLAERSIAELSDGERQKVMIARALAQDAALMLLDEPTAFLDLPRRVEIVHLLRDLAHQTGRAIVMSTHDLDLALRTADRVWLMSTDGAFRVGAPEDLVLSGALEAAFENEGMTFDREQGVFRVNSRHGGAIALSGEGTAAIWTRRALERGGFDVVPDAVDRVEVVQNGDKTLWRVCLNGEARDCDSLYALSTLLREQKQD